MLDNLKLGYGGTKTEMQRLIEDANRVKAANGEMANLSIERFGDVVEAIHIMQTQMGITGTTAKEASETISGSTASMKAAWENLKTGIADENADMELLIGDFVDSAYTAADNLLDRVFITIEGIKGIFSDPEQRNKFIQLGKDLLDTIVKGITNDEYAKTNFAYISGWLAGSLYEIVSDVANTVWDWIENGVSDTGFSEDFKRGLMQGSETLRNSGQFSWGYNYDVDTSYDDITPTLTKEYSDTFIPAPTSSPTVKDMRTSIVNNFNVIGTDEESARRMANIVEEELEFAEAANG